MVTTWDLAIDWNGLDKVCFSCFGSYCGKNTQPLGPFCLWQCLKIEKKKLGNPGDTYRYKKTRGAILVLNLRKGKLRSSYLLAVAEEDIWRVWGTTRLISCRGGKYFLLFLASYFMSPVVKGEYFFSFFCIPFHAGCEGRIFYYSFFCKMCFMSC